jgi:hypothetical protein
VAFQLALYFGVRRDPETASALGGVYDRLVAERSQGERRAFVEQVIAAVRGGASTVLALLPVLQREHDAGVARAAALAFATLLPAEAGDPLSGPRALRALLDHAEPDGVRAGLVGALLASGDRGAPAARWRLALAHAGRGRGAARAAADVGEPARGRVAARLDGGRRAGDVRRDRRLAGAAGVGGGGRVLELEHELPAGAVGDQ